ncbi:hypothetical protein DH2020_000022 [Rehmannia glutinosa]|uniref:GPI transamidase component PIG-T n=1 Tax=Rehmannia glutinosa TaxID=99300 RepID=A0ABR0XVA9_REHGL
MFPLSEGADQMSFLKSSFLLFLVLFSASESTAEEDKVEKLNEEFKEALLLRPLPDRKVLAHFHFQSSAPPTRTYGRHHYIFPKSIYQLVHKFQVREMELSFTQGRWNYERWGGFDPISNSNAKPPGVELWADFDVPQDQVDDSWKNLTHALSGLFCASINFLEHSTSYSAPQWSFRSFSGKLRYGMLPREAVCTENLTPWLKLLPCRDKAGLSSLLDRPSIYRGYYHSQRLHLKSDEFDTSKMSTGIVLEQTLTVVLQPNTFSGKISQPSWSLSSLFGRKVSGKCSLSNSSNVVTLYSIYHFPKRVIKGVENLQKKGSILYEFPVEDYDESEPFDLELRWKVPVVWSCEQTPLRASRFLLGSGNERGAIAISMKSTKSNNVERVCSDEKECWLKVGIFQVVPWYVKVYYHTLELFLDGEPQSTIHSIEKIRVSPSEDKLNIESVEAMENEAVVSVIHLIFLSGLSLRPNLANIGGKGPILSSALHPKWAIAQELRAHSSAGFLHIDEYPSDANQGFDIPSAVVHFADFQSNMSFDDNFSTKVPILSKLQEKTPVLSYTEVLLVPLTTPDFSMPYNVITITCTVFALYFGSLLNALRRRVGEEERLLRGKAKKTGPLTLMLSKLFAKLRGKPWEPPKTPSSSSSPKSSINYKLVAKVALVACIAAAWQYYFQ